MFGVGVGGSYSIGGHRVDDVVRDAVGEVLGGLQSMKHEIHVVNMFNILSNHQFNLKTAKIVFFVLFVSLHRATIYEINRCALGGLPVHAVRVVHARVAHVRDVAHGVLADEDVVVVELVLDLVGGHHAVVRPVRLELSAAPHVPDEAALVQVQVARELVVLN